MGSEEDKLISKLLNETYDKVSSTHKSNVINLSDYFNRRETYFSDKSKGIESEGLNFYYKDYTTFRRVIFGETRLDIPKGLGLLSIDPSFGEEILFKITDEAFKQVISKKLARDVTHIWLKGGSRGVFMGLTEAIELRKKVA